MGILTVLRGHKEVDLAGSGDGPNLHDGGAQLQVCLVHLRTLPDVDLQVVSDKGEERGGEGDPALLVYWHVHPAAKRVEDEFGKVGFCFSNIAPDQSFVGHLVGAFLPKAKRGVNVFEQLHGLCVVKVLLVRGGLRSACVSLPQDFSYFVFFLGYRNYERTSIKGRWKRKDRRPCRRIQK